LSEERDVLPAARLVVHLLDDDNNKPELHQQPDSSSSSSSTTTTTTQSSTSSEKPRTTRMTRMEERCSRMTMMEERCFAAITGRNDDNSRGVVGITGRGIDYNSKDFQLELFPVHSQLLGHHNSEISASSHTPLPPRPRPRRRRRQHLRAPPAARSRGRLG